jgi:hypothetical protein
MVALCNVLVPYLLPFAACEFHRVDVNEYMQIAKIEEDTAITFEIRIISCPPASGGMCPGHLETSGYF